MNVKTHTLSGVMAMITVIVTSLAVLASGTLIILTTHLHQTSTTLAAAVESVHLAEETEIDLLLHQRAADGIVKTDLEGELRGRLFSMRGHVTTNEETAAMDEAEARIEAYLAAARRDPSVARIAELHQSAYAAVEALIQLNVAQSRMEQERAAQWNRLANVIGVTISSLLVILGGSLLWWLKARAFRPVLALARTMERFGQGDRAARVEEAGPRELRDIARRFNEMASSLASQRDAQMAFLGGVAHDLRNPLGVLKTSLYLLGPGQELPPEPEIRRILQIVDRQIARLERMVGDFLDMAKIEAGELELQLGVQDASALVHEICELFQGASPRHRIEVSTPDAPVRLHCDPLRIEQVVNNLVSNAVKYSPRGGTVRVAVTREADEAVIAVTDQGIGISAEDQQRLFEPFRRVGAARQTVPGLGLGLFVARRLVEAHGGRIEVESRPARGSTFRIHLPALADDEDQQVPGQHDHRRIH